MVEAPTYVDTYLRSLAYGGGPLRRHDPAAGAREMAARRAVDGARIPARGLTYLRFWTVRALLAINPMRLFAGSPLVVLYLRALGARVGPRVLLLNSTLPVTTDLLTIGADTVVSRGALISGYRIDSGWARLGAVHIGARAYVGDGAVLDVDTAMGEDTQLGHASALLPGQSMPDGARWHGVPGRPTDTTFRRGPQLPYRRWRPALYATGQLVTLLCGLAPVLFSLIVHTFETLTPGLIQALLGISAIPWDLHMYELLVGVNA